MEGAGDDWKQKRYRGQVNYGPFLELSLGFYFTFMAFYAATNEIYGTLPFILIFQSGYLYAAVMSLVQTSGRVGLVREQEA